MRVPSYSDGPCDEPTRRRLQHLVAPHVDSFDFFLQSGMHLAAADVSAMELRAEGGALLRMYFDALELGSPTVTDDGVARALGPREARERCLSYGAPMSATVEVAVDGQVMRFVCSLGEFPIMVMSERCHLRGLSASELVPVLVP